VSAGAALCKKANTSISEIWRALPRIKTMQGLRCRSSRSDSVIRWTVSKYCKLWLSKQSRNNASTRMPWMDFLLIQLHLSARQALYQWSNCEQSFRRQSRPLVLQCIVLAQPNIRRSHNTMVWSSLRCSCCKQSDRRRSNLGTLAGLFGRSCEDGDVVHMHILFTYFYVQMTMIEKTVYFICTKINKPGIIRHNNYPSQ